MKTKLTDAEQYKQDVYDYLDRLPACTKNLSNLKDRERFLKVAKEYITERGTYNGYCTEFTSDYSAIRKWDLIFLTPAEKLKREMKENL